MKHIASKALTCDGQWVTGVHFFDGVRDYIIEKITDTDHAHYGHYSERVELYVVKPETICRYTGLAAYWVEDEECVEEDVWENDILKVEYEDKVVVCQVKWESGIFLLLSNEFDDGYIPIHMALMFDDTSWLKAENLGNSIENTKLKDLVK